MTLRSRRELFADVGRGMLAAGLGSALAADLGFSTAWAADDTARLTFGDLDPLVDFLRDTPADKLVPKAVEKIKAGTELKHLVAAAALANARAFGGEDYVGFHTLMALAPAYLMSKQEPDAAKKAVPVLKVLHRNATRLGEFGRTKETLTPVKPARLPSNAPAGETLRELCRKHDMDGAEASFAAVCQTNRPAEALDALLYEVDDATEVHRVVLVSRAWDLISFVGVDRAHTMLRQSVRYCVKGEKSSNQAKYNQELRELLPKLLDQYKLIDSKPGSKVTDDTWVEKFAMTVFAATAAAAADAVAAALAEGISTEVVGEALSLAANQYVLRDPGRPKEWASAGKPEGSVHGDSVGVHCCDTIHAWRNLARAGDRRTQVTSLILAGYQVARDRSGRPDFVKWEPYPRAEHREAAKKFPLDTLVKELDGAIREKNQPLAAAVAARIGAEKPGLERDVFALLRGYAITEDGALHAEKYYGTVADEFAAARNVFKWRQLVALARVSASAYGYAAPGVKEACEVLKG